jgi:3',5'-cyclic AMP phosphodiesterase CpdA
MEMFLRGKWGRKYAAQAGISVQYPKYTILLLTFTLALCLAMGAVPVFPAVEARAQAFYPGGSLPQVAKRINQLIYPTFGNPSIRPRGSELVIEWDWRLSVAGSTRPELQDVDEASDWEVWVTTSLAANRQNYNGSVTGSAENPPLEWYRYDGPSYGTYAHPVHNVTNTRALPVKEVRRGASERWPEIFGQRSFEVDHIVVEIPANLPLDLYDLHVSCVSPQVVPAFRVTDSQPHALQVIEKYSKDLKIVQITDTHVYGQEIKNGLNLDYTGFELREPRPGTPARADYSCVGWPGFPLDKDKDGKSNEGAIYLQEELQAINLIDPDFVVFTGDCCFGSADFNTWPQKTLLWGEVSGDMGTEYRFEYTWWYDELLALNVPVFCVPGNHDSYCWDGHVTEHDDGQEIWQDLFGPLYYSWDYGEMSFLAVNGMDWDKMDADGPEPFVPEHPDPILWPLAKALFPELGQEWVDRNGFLVDGWKVLLPVKAVSPHKWHAQVRGGGDTWEWQPWPWGPDPEGDGFSGQLAWLEGELRRANLEGKALKGVFMHFDPLWPPGSPPEAWQHTKQFGLIDVPAGEGEGSQALMYLLRKYEVSFVASGHEHRDAVSRIDWAPYGGSPGQLVSINTTASEPPVDGESLLMDRTSEDYAGYRLISIEDAKLDEWGFAGANGDPDRKWSIPGWEGLEIGKGKVNSYSLYRSKRPALQWMEQEDSADPDYLRPDIVNGEGTFSRRLPLNESGPFEDVTCKVKNTLQQPGAVLNLSDCRIEFPMKRLSGGRYYAVQNGEILEQYDTDSGERMVVVLADVDGGSTLPVRVCVGGTDKSGPVVDEAKIGGGARVTGDLEVELNLRAHDQGAGLMDFRVSNTPHFAGAEWIPCRDGEQVNMTWRLSAGGCGLRRVYVQFRDAAMPGNVTEVRLTVLYRP